MNRIINYEEKSLKLKKEKIQIMNDLVKIIFIKYFGVHTNKIKNYSCVTSSLDNRDKKCG